MSILFVEAQKVRKQNQALRKTDIAEWTSRPLNQTQEALTLRKIAFFYVAPVASFIYIRASGDGGATWGQERPVTINVAETQARATIGFNVSGDDLRVQYRFPQQEEITVISMTPRLVKRSEINLS